MYILYESVTQGENDIWTNFSGKNDELNIQILSDLKAFRSVDKTNKIKKTRQKRKYDFII